MTPTPSPACRELLERIADAVDLALDEGPAVAAAILADVADLLAEALTAERAA